MEEGHAFFLPYDFPFSSHPEGSIMDILNAYRSMVRPCVFFCCTLLWARSGIGETFFTDVTEQVGLHEFPGRSARNVVFVDYDNDGFQDVFITENRYSTRRIGLFHNTGDGRFVDQTFLVPTDLHVEEGGAGAIFGDYDNDGDEDLFLPVWPHSVLLRNDRGRFTQVDRESDLTDSLDTENALWLDYDRDGYLDLYVSSYSADESFAPRANRLLRNNSDDTFTDQTAVAGLDILLHPQSGGSTGGMAAGDFNNDGWPDLYVGVYDYSNRLFLNDGQGGFQDATSGEIADEGEAFSIAIGDIDNDGDLDIFQGAGGSFELGYRSLMLLNLGEGQFLDVTEGVGLGVGLLGTNTSGTAFADIDNDGDLDLVVGISEKESGSEHFLLLNDGNGTFVDQTTVSGIEDLGSYIAVGDYDEDGFVDLLYASFTREVTALYRNNGNANHWLRVELVGIESNRRGIGARLLATSGDREQLREILGGLGRQEDERVAHFGLGARTQVDRLEVRWPSGQVDVLTDVPADQKIRVFEGKKGYHRVNPTMWVTPLPDSLVAGGTFRGTVSVRPARFEAEAPITGVVADWREMGGAAAVPLQASGDGTWQVETTLNVPEAYGYKTVSVRVDQSTSVGDYWTQLSHRLLVLPADNQEVFVDGVGRGWQLGPAETGAEQKLGFVSPWDGTLDIYLINENGTNPVRLTQNEGDMVTWKYGGLYGPNWDWSPDGKQIVVSAHLDGPPAIYVVNSDGTHLRQLTHPEEGRFDAHPSWSPDGTKIAFTSNLTDNPLSARGMEIWVMNADGSHPVKLADHPAGDAFPSWSPDGTKIAFASRRHEVGENRNYEIYVMDADGSHPVRLTDNEAFDYSPSWSPDGTKIAFRSADVGIVVMDADGSHPTPLPGTERAYTLSWSPDGTKIAFWFSGEGVFTVGLDGTGPTRVTWLPAGVGGFIPIWLPRGASSPVQVLNTEAAAVTYRGRRARELQAEKLWLATYQSVDPIVPTGYASLGFAFHPGDAAMPEGGWLKVRVNDTQRDLLEGWVDVTRREWQEVEIPLEAFALEGRVEQIEFSGVLTGTFYLADLRLVTAAKGRPVTAVTETQVGLPGRFALEPNYPNPFNRSTMIRFALPENEMVKLEVFNLMGQKVATLVRGAREAGTYTIHWDGRDDDGRQLASGVYLYRLRAGDGKQVETRKLLLLR